jgi:4,5-DOPA dioxygenase extradiol
MYDFYGFPKELYEVEYDAPAAPELADRVAALLGEKQPVQREDRAMDHGVWVPMVHMAPAADIPILQISLPSQAGPKALFELGRKLAPLREEGTSFPVEGFEFGNLSRRCVQFG